MLPLRAFIDPSLIRDGDLKIYENDNASLRVLLCGKWCHVDLVDELLTQWIAHGIKLFPYAKERYFRVSPDTLNIAYGEITLSTALDSANAWDGQLKAGRVHAGWMFYKYEELGKLWLPCTPPSEAREMAASALAQDLSVQTIYFLN